MSKDWIKTDEAGIYRHATIEGKWKVHTAAQNHEGEMKHRRKTLNEATLSDAIAMREQLKAEIRHDPNESDTVDPRSLTCFAADWVVEMSDIGRWNSATSHTNEQILREHILPWVGHVDVAELDREHIRKWIAHIESATYDRARSDERTEMVRYGHSSLRRFWAVMKHLVKALYLEGHCDRRLVEWCREIRGPQAPDVELRRERGTLTADELEEYLERAQTLVSTRYPEIVTLAWTGMRAGELYGLEWKHVDFDAASISIEQSYSKGRLKSTKTGYTRTVPMVPEVVDALHAQRQRMVRTQNVGGLKEDIVFPSDVGTRREASALSKPMAKVADDLELDVKVGPQVMRSTLTTLLNGVGVKRSLIMSITGHETEEMNDGYTRPRVEDQHVAIAELRRAKTG